MPEQNESRHVLPCRSPLFPVALRHHPGDTPGGRVVLLLGSVSSPPPARRGSVSASAKLRAMHMPGLSAGGRGRPPTRQFPASSTCRTRSTRPSWRRCWGGLSLGEARCRRHADQTLFFTARRSLNAGASTYFHPLPLFHGPRALTSPSSPTLVESSMY